MLSAFHRLYFHFHHKNFQDYTSEGKKYVWRALGDWQVWPSLHYCRFSEVHTMASNVVLSSFFQLFRWGQSLKHVHTLYCQSVKMSWIIIMFPCMQVMFVSVRSIPVCVCWVYLPSICWFAVCVCQVHLSACYLLCYVILFSVLSVSLCAMSVWWADLYAGFVSLVLSYCVHGLFRCAECFSLSCTALSCVCLSCVCMFSVSVCGGGGGGGGPGKGMGIVGVMCVCVCVFSEFEKTIFFFFFRWVCVRHGSMWVRHGSMYL